MKRKHFYRIMSMILIYTMLVGQLMVGEALATFNFGDDESPLLLEEDFYPDNSTPNTDNLGTPDDTLVIIPDDDSSNNGGNIQKPVEADPPALILGDDSSGWNIQKPEALEGVELLLDGEDNGNGGISIKVESSQQEVHDGDAYSFTVTVSDSDLNVEPNINPGYTLTIKMPEFLTTKDMDEVLKNRFQYFERDYIYDEEKNTITLTFKKTGEGETWVNVQFSITMTVSTIGYDGDGEGSIKVSVGDTTEGEIVKGNTDISVDVGTGSDSDKPETEPYLEKRIWSNYKNSEYGVDESYVMRDPDSPIGYVVAFGVKSNYEGSIELSDNMSNGNLTLCDVKGDTNATMSKCFTLYMEGTAVDYTAEDDSSLTYAGTKLGTIVISRFGTGFTLTCTKDQESQADGGKNEFIDVAVKYFACVTGDSNNITNTVSLSVTNQYKGSSSQNIRRYDSQGLVLTKSILSTDGEYKEVDITEDTTVTFRIILTQYGTGSLYKNGDIISIDNLAPCFVFDPDNVRYGEEVSPFLLVQNNEDRQIINIVKDGEGSISTGQYTIDFTVTIDKTRLNYGEQATNTVGNTVYIRRMAKLVINKSWLGDDSVDKGTGAEFTLYDAAGRGIARSNGMSVNGPFTLYIKADDLAGGVNTYTLRENVDKNSGYTAAKDMAVVIEKNTDGIVTIVSIDGIPYGSGMAKVTVENKPDSGKGSLTFKKYAGSADEANLLDGGKYELHKVEEDADGTEVDTLVETFSTVNGVWVKNDLPYGVYYVKEIFAPPGYVLEGSSTGRVELKKTAPHQGLSLVNQLYQNGEIEILKKDENNQPLAGVTFTIAAVPGPGINESKTTNGEGAVSFTGLVAGTYSITETLPEGYSGFAGPLYVTINEKGQAQTIDAANGVEVSGNSITINWKNTQLFGSLTITKLGGSDSSPLMGASFALYNSSDKEVISGSTNENGILNFTGLPYGDYKLKETAAPEGYVISPDLDAGIDVKISSKQSALSLTFTNQTQKGSIKVIKTDAVSKAVLKGAQFGLYSDENAQNLLHSGFTDSNGICLFTNLEKGTYYIKEISAPTGYQLNEKIIKVEVGIRNEGSEKEPDWDCSVPVENSKRLYKLTVKKTDESGTQPLAGAEFKLIGGGIEQTAVSGTDGIAVFTDLPFGEYTISETKAPDGYALAMPITVTIDGSNTPAEYSLGQSVDGGTIRDTHTTLTVYKVDDKDESKGLAGTGFKIRSGGKYVQATGSDSSYSFTGFTDSVDQGTVFMTGPDGTFILEYLPLGSYTLVEVQAPDGYVISKVETGFAIEYAFQAVKVGNTQIRAQLHLVKTDAFGKLLPGVGFTLKNAEGYVQAEGQNGSYTYTGIGKTPMMLYTGDDGSLTVDGLLWGIYTLDEVADTTPDGLLPKTGIQFEVTAKEHRQTINVGVKNERELGRFEFVKLDAQREPLPGAVFKLELVSGNEYSLSEAIYAVSDENGKVSFKDIPYGVYKLTEYLAPYGKELSNQAFYISIGGATCEGVELSAPPTQWVNDDTEIKVTVRKVSTDGTALAGAVFRILDEDGNVLIPTLTVNSTKGEEFELPVGVYYIEEVSAPANYVMESTPVRFQVTASGPNEVVLKNAPFTGSLTICKTDAADGSALAGAEFKVYGREDYALNGSQAKALFTVTTNTDGTARIDGIPAGEYAVVEVRAPAGYELSDPTVQYFHISNTEENASEQVELSFENQASRYPILIEKTDIDTGVRLSGASFAVSGPDFYTVVTTGDDGTVTVQVPRMGEYTIAELQAPEGYTIDPNVYSVTVNAHTPVGAVVQAHFNSQDYPTRILLQKVDEEGQPLEGAVFAIYRVSGEGESLMSFSSFSDGVYICSPEGDIQEIPAGSAVIEQLPVGEYVLRETASPDGYISLGDVEFTVDAGLYNESLTLTVENIPHSQGVAVCKENAAGIRLAGAEFSLYDEAGTLLESKTTGASGYAVFTGLGFGKYSIKETKAPAGYQPIDEEVTFEVDGNGEIYADGFVRAEDSNLPFYVFTVTNSPVEQSFRIKKISAVSAAALAGAQFRILGGGMDAVFTTGEDGFTPLITLPVGEYMLTEIKAPNGYIAESESHHLLVSEEGIEIDGSLLTDDTMLYTVENAPASFRLTIIKRDENSTKPLAGAGFTITGPDGSKYSLITDEDGRTEILDLQPGTYAISEVLAPKGYNVPLTGWSFTVDEGSMQISEMSGGAEHSFADGLLTITLSNKRTTGNLMIFKYDAGDESVPLPNAQFRVKDGEGNDVWFTVANGVYRFADSGTAGAGNLLTTNAMGQALLEGLPFGDYTVYEWEAPEGYKALSEGIKVKIREQDETTELRIPNERLVRKVTVLKQSDEENPINLIGAVFALYEVDGEGRMHFVSEATTLYDGKVEFTVPYGDYVIAEIRAPQGYELSNSAPVSFSYNADTPDDYEFSFIFRNEKSVYSLEVYKYDAENKTLGLENAEFAVTDSRGFTKLIVTGPDGVARLDNLPYDDYTVREVSAPDGYYLNDQVFTVSREQFTHGVSLRIEVPDTVIVGSVLLRKVDHEDNSLILDAKFTVYDSNDRPLCWQETENGYILSDEGETVIHAGEVTLSGLPAGTYRISEVEAPDGYLILDSDRSFTINADNALAGIEIEIENTQRKVAVGIIKMDAEDHTKRLEGAEFTLYRYEDGTLGEALMTVVSNRNGLAVFTDLVAGQYRIIETKAPEGYKLLVNPVDFRIDGDGRVFVGRNGAELSPQGGVFVAGLLNRACTKDFTVKKVSSIDGTALAGASFTISGDDASWRITTGKNGTATVSLPYGEYIIQELIAPDGYALDDTKHLITVSESGISIDGAALNELTYTIENSPLLIPVMLHKQDSSSGNALRGAEFTITGGGESFTLVTNASGDTDTIYLRPGTYSVSETKAPGGFIRPIGGWTLTVSKDGRVSVSGSQAYIAVNARSVTLTLENTKQPDGSSGGSDIAKTGQISSSPMLLTGAALMLLSFSGLMTLLISEYRRRRDASERL